MLQLVFQRPLLTTPRYRPRLRQNVTQHLMTTGRSRTGRGVRMESYIALVLYTLPINIVYNNTQLYKLYVLYSLVQR